EPSPARLAHVASARHLSIRPGEDVTPDELVDALAPRRKRRTHLSMMWDGAEEAVELATELGLRVSAS
ncbi:MAG: hypothetical protein MUF64_33340, partial [Polyangiaceae bacterium]|nr:hypothetical protein [Polyangiaceae bacterium]